ncbi:hypothetical protein [Microbacterium sp. 1.5R]|uniref:hypothetical protein n=1 Tax=Microbacterium sp. 1.5R TaxID=1916917 RepID=UPI00119FB7FF|nr:hypothetical protein [Microbacterium sp. 1.5R]
MSDIPQRAVDGQEPLSPPDPVMAQRYLDHVGEVTDRRNGAVDRRAQAWLQIANAVATAIYLLVFSFVMRSDATVEAQALVFVFLIWAQIVVGITQRHGMQRKLGRAQWPLIVGGIVLLVATVVFLLLNGFVPGFPVIGMFVPSAIALLALGGYGLWLLRRASADPLPSRLPRVRLDRGAQVGTILVGTGLGVIVALMGAPAGVLRSALLLIVILGVVVWMFATNSAFGLPAIGEAWRWPHLVAFALGAAILVGVVLPGSPLTSPSVVPPLLGLGILAAFVGASLVPGYVHRG